MNIIHRPTKAGSVGGIDKYGFGSWSTVLSWPTLPGSPQHMETGTTGGVVLPNLPGEFKSDAAGAYLPPLWGSYNERWVLSDGTVYHLAEDGVGKMVVETKTV